jgi:transposase
MVKHEQVRKLCIDYVASSHSSRTSAIDDAARIFRVGKTSIWRWLKQIQNINDYTPQRARIKKQSAMPPNHIKLLRRILQLCPGLSYVQQIIILRNLVGVHYSTYELRDALKRLNMTRKHITFMPMELDPVLRSHYVHLIRPGGPFRAKMFRAIDESHAVLQEIMRQLGLSPRGDRAFQRIFKRGGKSEGCSAILSMTIEGVKTVNVYDTAVEGNINCTVFEREFLDVILPQMNSYPEDDSLTLLVGSSVHNKQRLFAACQAVGVVPPWLALYAI